MKKWGLSFESLQQNYTAHNETNKIIGGVMDKDIELLKELKG